MLQDPILLLNLLHVHCAYAGEDRRAIAYVAQTPWIQSKTFKESICIGRPMDEALYERVLQACDMKDIAMFSFGDETGIGEKRINLSGGQKQQVQLAQALYQEANVYFLDDPLSVVDVHTSSHLLKVQTIT